MKRALSALAMLALVLVLTPSRASAQTVTLSVSYPAGWNMVGGPPGTVFGSASYLFGYIGGNYTSVSTRSADLCIGYWAYFTDPGTVVLPASATGPSQTCPVHAGFTLVGNPFAGKAIMPSGVLAYHWNPDRGAYDVVTTIPTGGSAWVYSSDAGTVTLQYAPDTPRIAQLLTISNGTVGPSIYTIHVGDSVKVLIPSASPSTATTDPSLLHIDAAGVTGPASCIGSSCAISLINQFWTWDAVDVGVAIITITPLCTPTPTVTCGATRQIQINIMP